jgi:hypothetical protein
VNGTFSAAEAAMQSDLEVGRCYYETIQFVWSSFWRNLISRHALAGNSGEFNRALAQDYPAKHRRRRIKSF